MTTLTLITNCEASTCSFNHDGCAAGAITLSGNDKASCATHVEIDVRGGLESANGQVGACQHLECTHNKELMCTAQAVSISASGDCLEYATA